MQFSLRLNKYGALKIWVRCRYEQRASIPFFSRRMSLLLDRLIRHTEQRNRRWFIVIGIRTKKYKEEFDPGSGWTLATGLTHASRGVTLRATTGARVSNTYPTCPFLGDSLSKERLIPYAVAMPHGVSTKDLSEAAGDAFHYSILKIMPLPMLILLLVKWGLYHKK